MRPGAGRFSNGSALLLFYPQTATTMAKNTMTTPAGVAQFCRIQTPDTKFDPDGIFKCNVVLEPTKEAKEFLKQLDEFYESEYREASKRNKKLKKAQKPWGPELDEDEKPTGNLVVKAKQNAVIKTDRGESHVTIKLFDAKGQQLKTDKIIGSGSKVRLAIEPASFQNPSIGFGITNRLRAVQVIDLVEYQGPSAEAYGFGEEEGTCAAEDLDEPGDDTDGDF